MNSSIKNWIIKVCKKYNLSSFYISQKDTYMIHFKGKALMGFTSKIFYDIPKDAREQSLLPILKRGLMLNWNENNRQNLYTKQRLGRIIYQS